VSNKHLATYIKDHFAGSEAALAILDHIERVHGGDAGELARALRPQFQGERVVLSRLLASLDTEESLPRRVAGWLSEKGLELKLKIDDPADGALHLLEAVEMLALGVHGKRGLWVALAASRDNIPALANDDYAALIAQAEAQRALIETVRLAGAKATFELPAT
jgi:hypothetical protein